MRTHWILPLYGVASLVLTWPLARKFTGELPAVFGPADSLLQVFLLGWGWEALTRHPLDVFHPPIFHPEPRALTYMDHLLGEAVLAGPVSELFGPAAGYNTLVLLSFILSAWFTYRLARLYGASPEAGCLAGFLFAFCPYRFSNLGELNQLQTQFLPLALCFGARYLRGRRLRDGIGCSLTLVVQSHFGWYGTFHVLTALGILVAWEVLREPGGWRRLPWSSLAVLALGTCLLAAPAALPYWIQQRAMPEFRRSLGETALWSADLLDYLRVNRENLLARGIPGLGHPQGYSPGLLAAALALGGCRELRGWWRGARTVFPLVALGGFLLSLGPVLQVAGKILWIPLPFALCYYLVPGFAAMRAPGRFALLVALGTALLAGLGYDRWFRNTRRSGAVPLVLGLALAGILAWSPGIPFTPCPDRASMPPVYAWLAEQPGADPVLEIPLPPRPRDEDAEDARRQFYVLYHRKPRLDGVSGFTSPGTDSLRIRMQSFPEASALREAWNRGARTLIVHYGDYEPAARRRVKAGVEAARALEELAAFGDVVVYALRNPGAAAGSY